MKRVLLVMIQPPGCSGVQGLIYNKLLPFFNKYGWEVHFAGPDPRASSVLIEKLDYPPERLHYSVKISSSLQFSARKNRHKKGSWSYVALGMMQLLSHFFEKFTRHKREAYLLRGIEQKVLQADAEWNFDLIAGKSPDFNLLSMVSRIAHARGKPFLALMDDPHGARDESGFYPTNPELQKQILSQSCGVIFMSPLTLKRYVDAGLVPQANAYCMTDSYPEMPWLYEKNRSKLARSNSTHGQFQSLRMIYLGMLPEWRPIEALLDAFGSAANDDVSIELFIYGFVYPAAIKRIQGDGFLSKAIQIQGMVSYTESHLLAEDADLQLVVIGPRHVDNYPSKFFEYLGHCKPILVLGPLQNPLRKIVEKLHIGIYVDSRDHDAILKALQSLGSNYNEYKSSYMRNASEIERYSAARVADRFFHILDQSYASIRR